MTNYTLNSCEELIQRYVEEFKGEVKILEEGCLGLGKILLHSAKGKKTIIISEFFINSWVSGHSIRKYNVIPKKYEKIIN